MSDNRDSEPQSVTGPAVAVWPTDLVPPADVVVAVGLTAYSLLTNRREQGDVVYVGRNATAAAVLVAIARRLGCGWDDLGMAGHAGARGARIGLAAAGLTAAICAAAATTASRSPAGRHVLGDRRAALSRRQLAWQTLVRIPLGTAAFEELAFRGVLRAVIMARRGPRTAAVGSSVAFGLWHIGPTAAAMRLNDVAQGHGRAQVAAVATTTAAGVLFEALRRHGGHLAAPWLVHWVANATTLLAAAAWQRRSRRPSRQR